MSIGISKDVWSIISNGRKLLYQCRHLLAARNGTPQPVMFLVSPTNHCQLDCGFCLYGDRDKQLILPTESLLRFADASKAMGVTTWELTGGGEPLLHPDINDLMDRLHAHEFAVGLMTNGLALGRLHHPEYFQWIRVSLHSDDSKWQELAELIDAVPKSVRVTFSYTATPGNLCQLPTIREISERFGWRIKIEPDWFYAGNGGFRSTIATILGQSDLVFLDPVSPRIDRITQQCYLHLIKPFCYTDGWLYACACAIEQKRDVLDKFRLCRMEDVEAYYTANPQPLALACRRCKYEEHNLIAQGILEPLDNPEFC